MLSAIPKAGGGWPQYHALRALPDRNFPNLRTGDKSGLRVVLVRFGGSSTNHFTARRRAVRMKKNQSDRPVGLPEPAPLTPLRCEFARCSEAGPISLNGGHYCRTHYLLAVGGGPTEAPPPTSDPMSAVEENRLKRLYGTAFDPLSGTIVGADLESTRLWDVPSVLVTGPAFDPLRTPTTCASSKTWSQQDGWRTLNGVTGKPEGPSDRQRLIEQIKDGWRR